MLKNSFANKRWVILISIFAGATVLLSVLGYLSEQKIHSETPKESPISHWLGNPNIPAVPASPSLPQNAKLPEGKDISTASAEKFSVSDKNGSLASPAALAEQELFQTPPEENWMKDKSALPRDELGYPVNYDMKNLEARKIGDRLTFPIPEAGMAVHGLVEDIQSNGGLQTWSGSLDGGSQSGKFSITHASSDNYAVGNVSFGSYSYQIESIKGNSKITLLRDLAGRHID